MVHTIFNAAEEKQKKQRKVLEERLKVMVDESKSTVKKTSSSTAGAKKTISQLSQKTATSTSQLGEPIMKNHHSTHTSPEKKRHSHKKNSHEYSSVLRDEQHRHGWFSSFMPQPKSMYFDTQQEDEEILLILRQHPIVNLPWIVITIVLFFVPLVVFPFFPIFAFLPGPYIFFAFVGWYLLLSAFVLESFLNWYFNIYILTDERIIDIDFYSLIYKSVAEAKISKVEDVTATTSGFFGAMFNYGTISIQTAAEKREFEFVSVPQPSKVTKFLNELILEEEREAIEGRVS